MTDEPNRTSFFSPARVSVIAGSTFTQLVRMKVFYLLLVFVMLAIGMHLLPDLPHTSGPEALGAEKLRMIKSTLVGFMKLFAVILGIVSTALLIPRDLEDRTLYTILSKPVPRLDYLVGKLLGVLLLIFVGLAAMTLLLSFVLHYQTELVLTERITIAERLGWDQDAIAAERAEILRHGVTWSLMAGIVALFFEAGVIAAVALLVSTFSSSTIFTVVTSSLVYFIGSFIADGREYWLNQSAVGDEVLVRLAAQVLSVIFPDFRLYGITDAAVGGDTIPLGILAKLTGITVMYIGIYTVLSWFVFADKEI
ncbi:MAG: ABC transporter permease subunit [Akkermansiaceae bacterium]|nr:ABC transporter permease subunit [Akkermansiaceae bacterium]